MEFKGTSVYEKSNEYAKSKCSEEIGSKFIPETNLTVYDACELDFRKGYNQALKDTKAPEMLEMIEELIYQFESNNNSSQETDLLNEAKQLIKQTTEL